MDARRTIAVAFWLVLAAGANGQCILANGSFELAGSGGNAFGGWNQFGVVASSTAASHGHRAARVAGSGGSWTVSAVWQRLDSAPGERWAVSGQVRPSAQAPFTGGSIALVNVEWRDASDQLIDYDSFPVADAATPTDAYAAFAVTSQPAPAGTAAIHVLFGVLQAPGVPAPAAVYDQVMVESATNPPEQWGDFPGGRRLDFAGRSWRVKGPGYYGPGPNVFSDDPASVWVDAAGLHLTLARRNGTWTSTEVTLADPLGYGDYVVTTVGPLENLDLRAVLGIFLWRYGPCWSDAYLWWNPYDEIDIEYGRWGQASREIGQFVAQPYDYPGNLSRFDATFDAALPTSHAMRWLPDRVEYRVWRGGPSDESAATTIRAWTYTGPHIPRPEEPRLHLNLWRLEGSPAAAQEVVIAGFAFAPAGSAVPVPALDPAPAAATLRLLAPAPNPCNPRTTIRFELARDGGVTLAVHDLAGRRLRTLSQGYLRAGEYQVPWDGRDDAGRAVASGAYLVRLVGDDGAAARRVTVVR